MLNSKNKIRTISDLAFDAVDNDRSNSLDAEELSNVMKEVARLMRITPPSDVDIQFILSELEDDTDG